MNSRRNPTYVLTVKRAKFDRPIVVSDEGGKGGVHFRTRLSHTVSVNIASALPFLDFPFCNGLMSCVTLDPGDLNLGRTIGAHDADAVCGLPNKPPQIGIHMATHGCPSPACHPSIRYKLTVCVEMDGRQTMAKGFIQRIKLSAWDLLLKSRQQAMGRGDNHPVPIARVHDLAECPAAAPKLINLPIKA